MGEIAMKSFNLEEYLENPSKKVVTRDDRDGVHISKSIFYDMCDNIDNISEEFHAANAHDIMDYITHSK